MIVGRGLKLPLLLAHVGPLLLTLLIYDVVVTALFMVAKIGWLGVADLPLPLLGSAIALVVTLRNNVAYGRWSEARALWGSVINDSRSFARTLLTLVGDEGVRSCLALHQASYARALRCHLLRLPPWDDLQAYLPGETITRLRTMQNVPLAIQREMAGRLADARASGVLDTLGVLELNRLLSNVANAQGGLERIKNTPLPRQYNQFPRLFTRVYCLLLPLGVVRDLGWLTPLGSTLIGFMFLALDQSGHDLEDPFEGTVHDVPMAAITRTIEIDVLQMIGRTPVPPPVVAEAGVLR